MAQTSHEQLDAPTASSLCRILVVMRTAVIRRCAAALVIALTAGCGQITNPDTTVEHSGSVYLLKETERFQGDSGGFGVIGKIGLVAGRCVGFTFAGRDTLIVFPPSAKFSGVGAGTVRIEVEGHTLQLGQRFNAGSRGGPASLSKFGDLSDQAPAACRRLPALPVDGFVS